jgi:hypothetical protein
MLREMVGTLPFAHPTNSRSNFKKPRYDSAFSPRDAPELCMKSFALKTEGVGNAGRALHPQPRVQMVK